MDFVHAVATNERFSDKMFGVNQLRGGQGKSGWSGAAAALLLGNNGADELVCEGTGHSCSSWEKQQHKRLILQPSSTKLLRVGLGGCLGVLFLISYFGGQGENAPI